MLPDGGLVAFHISESWPTEKGFAWALATPLELSEDTSSLNSFVFTAVM
jgi:hypothetical protein